MDEQPVYKRGAAVYIQAEDSAGMNLIEDVEVVCPFCGSSFVIEVDSEAGSYVTHEDCAVCCRPLVVRVRCQPGRIESIEAEPG
jgi:hypothetical protein